MKRMSFRSRKASKGYTLVGLLFCLFWLLGIIGWVHNIVNVVHGVSALSKIGDASPMLVFQCIGIPAAPVGAILGLIVW